MSLSLLLPVISCFAQTYQVKIGEVYILIIWNSILHYLAQNSDGLLIRFKKSCSATIHDILPLKHRSKCSSIFIIDKYLYIKIWNLPAKKKLPMRKKYKMS